ncbi:MAG: cation:dicarboxylase symporter family transporter, partial [Bacteroidetes bacterium]|nr:cation:dicarboxylase symporter family transporter [Bacteroidota bacterium]
MKDLALHWKIIIGLIIGIIYSFVSSWLGWNNFTIDWIDPFGQIFIRLLKFIAVPLVLFSIIGGISSMTDLNKLGRMGGKTIAAYLTTTFGAVLIGLLIVNTLGPGTYMSMDQREKNRIKYEMWVKQTDGVEVLDGKNYLEDPKYASYRSDAEAALNKELANADVEARMAQADQMKDAGPLSFLVDFVPDNIFDALSDSKKMLQVIFFAIFFGIVLLKIPEEFSTPVKSLINGINEVFLKMVEIVMNAAPYFVFALMAGVIAKMADTPAEVFEIFKGLLSYSLTLILGLAFMVFVVYPLIMMIFFRKISYTDFFKKLS